MRVLILLAFVAYVAAEIVAPTVDYHEAIGIPEAARIKAAEEDILARGHVNASADRIVGGAVAPQYAHPYLGGLVISLIGISGNSVCGSSLLSANRLVTAAHCWFDGNNQAWQFTVVLGSQLLFFGGTRIPTSTVILHAGWTPSTLQNDVAMIYLPYDIAFSQSVQPIPLPFTTQVSETFAGWWGGAAGYGKTSDVEVGVSSQTQVSQVSVQVITNEACAAVFGHWVTTGNICTNGVGGVGICGGDSGGPLVVNVGGRRVLVGISSFVAAIGCQYGFPSAYARVTSFYTFILGHLL